MREISPTLSGTVTDLARAGSGIVKLPTGEVVFIPYTAPGDEIRFKIVEKNKNYSVGVLVEVLKPSNIRISPECLVFTKCGGCMWQHLPYSLQMETKTNGVLHALKRAGVIIPDQVKTEVFPAQKTYLYRNRVQLRGDQRAKKFGFFEKGTNNIVDIERCEIADPAINELIPQVKEKALRDFEVSKVELVLNPNGVVNAHWNQKHAASGFSQVHSEQNQILKNWIISHLPRAEVLFDLYGGSGNLSELIQNDFKEVHCVDLGSPKSNGPGFSNHFYFHRSHVSDWLKKLDFNQFKQRPISIILDPPREGLSSDFNIIAESIFKLKLSGLVLVGCDPDSFARDVYRFTKKGLRVEKLAAVDLFPQTPHIESLALLLP